MAAVKINSMVKLYTLCLLNKGPKHGYEIIKELESKMSRSISASHIYPFLKSLENNKCITCKTIEKRDKKSYSLTKNGQELVEIVFDRLGDVINSVVERKLTACPHCNCKVYEGGYVELTGEGENIFCCKHCAKAHKDQELLVN